MQVGDPRGRAAHVGAGEAEVAVAEPQDERTEVGERQAPEPAHDGRRVGVDDEQGETGHAQAHDRRDEHPGERGEEAAEHPAERGRGVGVAAGEAGELAVVDHGAHGHAEAGPVEEQPQPQRDQARGRQHHQAVPRDGDAADVHQPGVAEERGQRVGLGGAARGPQHVADADEGGEQADGDHDLGDGRRLTHLPHDHALDHDAHERRQHQQHQEQRQGRRQVVVDAQLPVGVGRDHPDGAVREVEDAGGGVGDDQPARRDRIDARRGEAQDRVLQELGEAHPATSPPGPCRSPRSRGPCSPCCTRSPCRGRSARTCRPSPAGRARRSWRCSGRGSGSGAGRRRPTR